MIKNRILKLTVCLTIVIFCFLGSACLAQEPTLLTTAKPDDLVALNLTLKAVAGEDRNVVVGRQILFSASASSSPDLSQTRFEWTFGDGIVAEGIDVTHVYNIPGIYRAMLKISYQGQESIDEFIVSVDKDIILLLTDSSVSASALELLQNQATTQGILLVNLQTPEESIDYLAETNLAQKIIENKDEIKHAKNILVWTNQNVGINALIAASQEFTKTATLGTLGFQNKNIIILTDKNLSATSRLAQNVYNLLTPQSLILTSKQAGEIAVTHLEINDLINSLKEKNIEYQLLGVHTQRTLTGLKPWNFLSFVVNYMVNNGIPLNTVYLLLILPLIATLISFARQVVGIKAFGIYAPSLVAVSFLATGITYGILIFVMVLGIGTIGRLVARRIRLMYLPRMAIVLSVVSFSILGVFCLGVLFNKTGLAAISIFPILIMVIITEKFLAAQIEHGSREAFSLSLETLLLSTICYFMANWQSLKVLILGYPELILITFLINYFLGKWGGLRLLEYYRFRKVIKNVELPEKK